MRKWCENQRLNSFESLLSFEPHRDCQGDLSVRDLSVPFCVGWKTALQTAVSGLQNNGKIFSYSSRHFLITRNNSSLCRISFPHSYNSSCYLSINYLLAQALHLLCVESYVLMCLSHSLTHSLSVSLSLSLSHTLSLSVSFYRSISGSGDMQSICISATTID